MDQLNQDIHRQLILICAPAGFGKTTLVGNWLEQMAAGQDEEVTCLPSAWLSLDENDSDLIIFLRYVIAALRTIFNEACAETEALLLARQKLPQSVLYTTFSNELERLPGEAILVMDDYHTIRGEDVHNLLNELVRHWPKPLHLVLISRISPPLPLSNLRAKGVLSEIRTRDLRFTPEETVAYLSQSQYSFVNPDAMFLLEDRFEGWPTGLHLASLSLRSADSQESVLLALSSENTNITEYLVDEVLTHQLPAIHSFLLKTSILDRFCASLCEAVIGEIDPAWDGRACLDWISRSELFIISLDNRREWYRYHHLFQELLQQRLVAERTHDQINDLHLLASAWFEEHGLTDEALHHTLAAGDLDLAARQMSTGLRDVLNREDRPTLERWLRLLPEEMIQGHPWLLMIKAWALVFTWRLNLQVQVIQKVEKLLDSDVGVYLMVNDSQILHGQVQTIKAQQAYFSNQPMQAIDLCRQALDLLPLSWAFVRGGAMLYLGMSMGASGQALAAERLLLDEYESCGDKIETYALMILLSLGFIYLNTGKLEQTRQIALTMLQGATRNKVAIQKNWAEWFLGVDCYHRNELQAAAGYFAQIVDNRYTAQITTYRDAVAGLALILQIQGKNSEALDVVESINQFDLEQRGNADYRTRSLFARLKLLQGDLEDAINWVDAFSDPPPEQPLMWLEEPQVTRVRILLTRGLDADLWLAEQILDALDEIVDRTHNTRYKIEILALRALALEAQGETDRAKTVLKQAIDLAQPGGFIRIFVDLGVPMQKMLHQLEKQAHPVETIQRILAAFPKEDIHLVGSESLAQPGRRPSLDTATLPERLTPRELEVLNLLRGSLSVKEIALELNISYATAKRHTINLYGKLGVNRRWDAVSRAEELNILPPR